MADNQDAAASASAQDQDPAVDNESSDAEDSVPERRPASSRSRKAVARFDPVSKATYERMKKQQEQASNVVAPGANDVTLGSLEDVAKAIGKHGANDEVLILLHRALFGRPGKATIRKAGIRKWFGTKNDATIRMLDRNFQSPKWTNAILGDLCQILCLEKSGNKAVVVDRVLSFLKNPTADHPDKKAPAVKKTKAAKKPKSKKKKKVKKAGPKRTASSYMIWLSEVGRAAAKKAHPDAKVTEIASYAGAMWRELSAEEKQEYTDKALELKAAAAAASPRKASKSKSAAKPKKRKASGTAKGAPPAKTNSATEAKSKLKNAKELLDEGLIDQAEYSDVKAEVLKMLKSK